MKAFELTIWQPVYRGSNYLHTAERIVVVHAPNRKVAEAKIPLRKGEDRSPHYITKDEYVYSVRDCGQVVIVKYYEYTKDDHHSPISVERYKANLKRVLKEAIL